MGAVVPTPISGPGDNLSLCLTILMRVLRSLSVLERVPGLPSPSTSLLGWCWEFSVSVQLDG